MAKRKKATDWSNKRCPLCGSPVDMLETCRRCGRAWSEKLAKEENAVGLQPGKQYDPYVAEPKRVGKRKTRKTRFVKSQEELQGKKFVAFTEDLPPQFSGWQVQSSDDESEIHRKRSLMRLDSQKIYNQMGLSVRAQESAKAALLWISKLWGFLEIEEQQVLASTLEGMKDAFGMLTLVRQAKIGQALRMEKAMEKAHQQARKARVEAASSRAKSASKFPPAESDSEGLGLMPLALDPQLLLEQAKERLLRLEKTKRKGKTPKPAESTELPETE
jgi:hypothetical protein